MTHMRRWGAVYILILLFVGSWLGQFFTQLAEFTSTQQQHGQPFVWGDYLHDFFASTFENWQSEWLQLLVQAVVLLGMKHLLFKADAQDMEQVQLDLAEIKQHLGIPPRDDLTASTPEDVDALQRGADN